MIFSENWHILNNYFCKNVDFTFVNTLTIINTEIFIEFFLAKIKICVYNDSVIDMRIVRKSSRKADKLRA